MCDKIEGCNDPTTRGNGMCESHFHRWYTYGDAEAPLRRTRSNASWEERLTPDKWDKVPGLLETDCWVWNRQIDTSGYGVIKYHQKAFKAHRAMWSLHTGEQIPPGMYACHMCDNPPCVNPEHIFIGTQDDNMKDAMIKGRSRAPRKLTDDQVREIRYRVTHGETQSSVAKDLGVHNSTVNLIIKGKTYRNVIGQPDQTTND